MGIRTTARWSAVALGGWMIGAAANAAASDHGFYMNVDAGIASYPNDVRAFINERFYERESGHASDFAWSFAAGYRFNRYLAAELGFSDLGHAHSNLVDPGNLAAPDESRGDVDLSARGKSLALLAHVPMGNWDPYLKVGAFHSTFAWDVALKTEGSEFQRNASREQTNLLVGLGARYAYTDQWALSFAVDYYNRLGISGDGRANLISPRVGFAYRF